LGLSAGQNLDRARAINGEQLQAITMQETIAAQRFLLSVADDYERWKTMAERNLAIPAGFEPATHGVEIRYSIQLSYGTVRAVPALGIRLV
jgi:hypothetical protein